MESLIGKKIQIKLASLGYKIWRNNVGQAWTGSQIIHMGADILIKNARPIKFGLCQGSSDYIGLTPKGRFLAVEAKSATGQIKTIQQDFINMVNLSGGIAFVARSPDEAEEKIGE